MLDLVSQDLNLALRIVYFFMIITCETCGIKFNNETKLRCAICHPKRISNSPSRKRNSKKHWEKVKLHGQKNKMLSEQPKSQLQKYDYYYKGKRK